MPRLLNRGLQIVLDVAVLSIAYWLAFLFRLEFSLPRQWLNVLLDHLALRGRAAVRRARGVRRPADVVALRQPARGRQGPVRDGGGDRDPGRAAPRAAPIGDRVNLFVFPLGVLAMDFVLAFMGLVGVRAARRLQGEAQERKPRSAGVERHRVLLIGAGQAGVLVAREIAHRPDLGLKAVGFIDDDPMKVGTSIGGLPVLGTTDQVGAIAERKRAKRALITIANAPGAEIRRITELCRDAGLDTKIIPGIYEIVGDKVNLSRIREVAIEDLLGREPVQLDEDVVGASIGSRVVLVTGAGGSIGSELCRQVCRVRARSAWSWSSGSRTRCSRSTASWPPSFPHVPIEPLHRRRLRRAPHGAGLRRAQARGGLPRRRPQARADDGVEPGRGDQEQRRRHPRRRRPRRPRSASQRFVHDLDRQGGQPDLGHGRDQARRRDLRAGARAAVADPVRHGALRQRAGLGRQRHPDLQAADRRRRAGHRHPPRDAAATS